MIKRVIKRFVLWTKPFVWRLASAYDIRLERHCHALGSFPLIIEDTPEAARHHIPKSVVFNTRSGSITVGKNVVFGWDVLVLAGTHLTYGKAKSAGLDLHHVPEAGKDISIGEGCYIGSGAILIGPLRIGEYAAVGAGAVVTKDVSPRTLVGGCPAKVIKAFDNSNDD